MKTGLVSVTFRNLTPEEIVPLVHKAGLEAIEWGGDVHVPPQDPCRAQQVYELCRTAGILTPSYGSYYRCGVTQTPFEEVCRAAKALHADTIRVWAGDVGSRECSPERREEITADARRIAKIAGEDGLTVAFEFHNGTLTDYAASGLQLLQEMGCNNARLYWQPLRMHDFQTNRENLRAVEEHLANLHAFGNQSATIPMEQSAGEWEAYKAVLDAIPGSEQRVAYLEFVREGSVEQFFEDAACLRRILG